VLPSPNFCIGFALRFGGGIAPAIHERQKKFAIYHVAFQPHVFGIPLYGVGVTHYLGPLDRIGTLTLYKLAIGTYKSYGNIIRG
jgi:hypothetical protein